MPKLRVHNLAMSLDGYAAGPNQSTYWIAVDSSTSTPRKHWRRKYSDGFIVRSVASYQPTHS